MRKFRKFILIHGAHAATMGSKRRLPGSNACEGHGSAISVRFVPWFPVSMLRVSNWFKAMATLNRNLQSLRSSCLQQSLTAVVQFGTQYCAPSESELRRSIHLNIQPVRVQSRHVVVGRSRRIPSNPFAEPVHSFFLRLQTKDKCCAAVGSSSLALDWNNCKDVNDFWSWTHDPD